MLLVHTAPCSFSSRRGPPPQPPNDLFADRNPVQSMKQSHVSRSQHRRQGPVAFDRRTAPTEPGACAGSLGAPTAAQPANTKRRGANRTPDVVRFAPLASQQLRQGAATTSIGSSAMTSPRPGNRNVTLAS